MSFEEFFKKKKIDLPALEAAEGALFSEFKTHFQQMGEKSFDHTKKYWFNKLRRQFPLPPEVKAEKVKLENPLAEQTVTESLTEATPASPVTKLGFAPRFKAGNMPKPALHANDKQGEDTPAPPDKNPAPENPPDTGAPKPAYKPRFNMKNIPPKPAQEE
jgi:hypothetical protein